MILFRKQIFGPVRAVVAGGAVAIAALTFMAEGAVAAPAITLSDAEFNFGKIPQNAKVTRTYWIKSTGTDTLKVLTIVPGCGCTQMPLKDSTLAPGDSSDLEIVFSSKSMRGMVSKAPYITTNVDNQSTYMKIHAEVVVEPELDMPLNITPAKLDVSQFRETPVRRKAKVSLENKDTKEYAIEVVSYPSSLFKVSVPKKIPAGGTVDLEVEVLDSVLKQEFEKSVTIELTADTRVRYTIPVRRMYRVNKDGETAVVSPTGATTK